MKTHLSILFLIVVTFSQICISKAQESQETLQRESKISQMQAEQIASDKAKAPTVRAVDLAKKDGKLIWSIEVAKNRRTKDLIAVDVDAKSGKIVAIGAKTDTESQQRSKLERGKAMANQPYFGFTTTRKCCWRSDTCCNHRGVCCPGGK